ncbi:hypothetical protein T4B_15173 [Trichinella pseudospiralis]|uniref:Uncharacterized protein n=1 Tax=Trichinella pseudospiralis TaxID=6337 RepID=A0A0V1GT78_TRIPS|nr:hypothetical protein T4B_15173 [Trichinella pseudospiralis]
MTTIESADCGHARSSINLQHNLDTTQYVFGFVERITCWYNGFAYDYDDPSQILKESIAWFSLLNPASKAVALASGNAPGVAERHKNFAYANFGIA